MEDQEFDYSASEVETDDDLELYREELDLAFCLNMLGKLRG